MQQFYFLELTKVDLKGFNITLETENWKLLVNLDHISTIESNLTNPSNDERRCVIRMKNGEIHWVKESYDEIKTTLKEAKF